MRNLSWNRVVRALVMRTTTAVIASATALFVACSEATAPAPPTQPPPGEQLQPTELRPYPVVPTTPPAVNDQIVVQFAIKRGSSAPRVGSFAGTLHFDPTAFEFVADANPSDGVVAVNLSAPGELSVAGASAQGFATDHLAGATVKVLKTGALSSITITLDELTTETMEARKP